MDGLRLQQESQAPPLATKVPRQVPKDTSICPLFFAEVHLARTGPKHAPLAFSRPATERRDATKPVTVAANTHGERSLVDKGREQADVRRRKRTLLFSWFSYQQQRRREQKATCSKKNPRPRVTHKLPRNQPQSPCGEGNDKLSGGATFRRRRHNDLA